MKPARPKQSHALAVALLLCLGACEDGAVGPRELDATLRDAGIADAARTTMDGAVFRDASGDATSTRDASDSAASTGAASVDPAPLYAEATSYETTIPGHADPADVYYPAAASAPLPLALLLQGANVARGQYASYARRIARYGFIVVVPDHATLLGLFPEQQQVLDALAFFRAENVRTGAPLHGRVDVDTLVLLGHSFGGVAALGAVQGTCNFPFCSGSYTRPAALRAAALYGTNNGETSSTLAHGEVGVALLQGELDGKATPAAAQATYQALSTPPRALITLRGANHYGLCDVDNPSGAAADSSMPTLPQPELVARGADLAATFLRAVALGDDASKAWLRSKAEPDGGVGSAPFSVALDLP